MRIEVKYTPRHEAITVQGGQIDEDGTFWMEWCNHAGAEQTESSTWSAGFDGEPRYHDEQFNACDKCDETWDIMEDYND